MEDGKTATATITVVSPITGININKENATINVGDTALELECTKVPADATETITQIEWTSSNTKIAKVEKTGNKGNVTGLAHGSDTAVTITAKITTSGGKTFTKECKVKVVAHLTGLIITNPAISNNELALIKGQEANLGITYEPAEFVEQKGYTWETDHPEIAKIENGKVTAVSEGTAIITAKSVAVPSIIKTLTVKVTERKANTITIDKQATEIEKNETEILTATVDPANTTDEITWTSDHPEIAKVEMLKENENGISTAKITALKVGTAQITVTAGNKTYNCTVTVTCALNSISLNKQEIELEVGGQTETLTLTKEPIDATVDITRATFTSSNTSVVLVSNNGELTPVAPGTGSIIVTLDGKTATCKVTVKADLKAVNIQNSDTVLNLYENQKSAMKVEYTPANAVNIPTANWTSSNEAIAKVDKNGIVTAIAEGEAEITVNYGNSITSTRSIKVNKVLEGELAVDIIAEEIARSEQIKINLLTQLSEGEKLTWVSSDEGISTITNEGLVTGIKNGNVTFTGTVSNEAEGTNKTITVAMKVVENHIKSATVVQKNNQAEIGKNIEVKVEALGEKTSIKVTDDLKITYSSSDPSIAEVQENGSIRALKEGTVVITAQIIGTAGNGSTKTITASTEPITIKKASHTGGSSGGSSSSSNKQNYKFIEGMNAKYETGSKKGLTLKTNGEFEYFKTIYVDNKEVSKEHYTVEKGSTIITLKPEYLDTLKKGEHTVKVAYTNGETVETKFTIAKVDNEKGETNKNENNNNLEQGKKELDNTPKTGDINVTALITMMITSFAGMSIIAIKNKKIKVTK